MLLIKIKICTKMKETVERTVTFTEHIHSRQYKKSFNKISYT